MPSVFPDLASNCGSVPACPNMGTAIRCSDCPVTPCRLGDLSALDRRGCRRCSHLLKLIPPTALSDRGQNLPVDRVRYYAAGGTKRAKRVIGSLVRLRPASPVLTNPILSSPPLQLVEVPGQVLQPYGWPRLFLHLAVTRWLAFRLALQFIPNLLVRPRGPSMSR